MRFARPAIEEFTRILCFTKTAENYKKCRKIAKKLRKIGKVSKIRKGPDKVAKQMRKALRELKKRGEVYLKIQEFSSIKV